MPSGRTNLYNRFRTDNDQIMDHFLLIEDDIDDQEIFCMALQAVSDRIRCTIAQNGVDAVDRLKSEPSFVPDHIFVDVNMPKMNGLECLKAIKQIEKLKHARVIMYSTSDDQKMINLCRQFGADEFIVKPPSLESLKAILSNLISNRGAAGDTP